MTVSSLQSSTATPRTALHVEALLDPAQFDHETRSIRLLQTHISWVILTGDFAYKLKKPVSLGFLDFSSLALRKHFCEEELRLNRRFAPETYLAVVPTTGTLATPTLGGDGPAIDYAVKMREFPQSGLLDHVMREGGVSNEQIDALAERVASFHEQAKRASVNVAFASAEDVGLAVNENLEQLQPLLERAGLASLQTLRRWNEVAYQENKEFVFARRRDGYVRECHGDLHLGNVALVDGKPLIFACIEFSDDLRWIVAI